LRAISSQATLNVPGVGVVPFTAVRSK
jgi:hypothetical protein